MNSYFNVSVVISIFTVLTVVPGTILILLKVRGLGMAAAALVYGASYTVGIALVNSLIATFLARYMNVDNDWIAPSMWIHGTLLMVATVVFAYLSHFVFTKNNLEKANKAVRAGDYRTVRRLVNFPFWLTRAQKIELARLNRWNKSDEAIVRLLAKAGQAIGGAALCSAVRDDDVDAVKAILDENINPNWECNDGSVAAHVHSTEVMAELLKAGLDINYRTYPGADTTLIELLDGSKEYDLAREQRLISLMQKVQIPYKADQKGYGAVTALMAAARKDFKGIVQLLVDAGADVNAQNAYGQTALMRARTYGMVRLLLAAGASADLKNDDGETAIHVFKERKLHGAIAALEGVPQPPPEALLQAIRDRDIEQVKRLQDTPLTEPEEYDVLITALKYGTTEILDVLKPLFDRAAHRYPDTDYFEIASDTYPQNSSPHRALWVLQNNYVFNETKGIGSYFSQASPGWSYPLTEETSALICDLKAHALPLDRAMVRDYFREHIEFYHLADMPVTDDDMRYLAPLIQDYSWEDAKKYVDYKVLAYVREARKTELQISLNLLDQWIALHPRARKKWIGPEIDIKFATFSKERKDAFVECLRLLGDRPVQVGLNKGLAAQLKQAYPNVFTDKYRSKFKIGP